MTSSRSALTLLLLLVLAGCEALGPIQEVQHERREHELALLEEALRAQPIYIYVFAAPPPAVACECCQEEAP